MQPPGIKTQKKLDRIKKNVEKAYQYFAPNYKRFSSFRRFLYKSTLTDTDLSFLEAVQKPQVAFNVGQAYISRLRGEFSEQIPDIEVGSDSSSPVEVETIENVEGHIRHIFCDKSLLPNTIYEEQLSGGFSVMKVYTDYANNKEFRQEIMIKKVYDPTLVGYDPMAVEPTKCDADWCFEGFPMTVETFKKKHPEVDISGVEFAHSSFGAFNWSYRGQTDDVLLLVDYYEKKKKRVKLCLLSNNKILYRDEYDKYLEEWIAAGHIEQPAMIVKERDSIRQTIVRYLLIENKVIDVEETDYEELPLIYVPGDSQRVKDANSENVEEIARPYLYNAQDAIRLKNFAGQCLANELENQIQHKMIVAKEALPDEQDYRSVYTNIQTMGNYIYNAFLDDDPNIPIPAPTPVIRPPIPPEIMAAFTSADQTIQQILGSYDAALGAGNNSDISGRAIVEGATHSNAAAMPYVMGYLEALEQAGKIIVGLIPKYYKTAMTIPIINKEGKRTYVKINQENDKKNKMNYESNALNVKVRAGANFSVQKNRALNQVIMMSKASESWAAFFNAKGLPIILDNMEIRGIERLKDLALEWQKEQEQARKQAQNMPNPEMIKAQAMMQKMQLDGAKLQKELREMQQEFALRTREMTIDENQTQNETLRILLDSEEAHLDHVAKMAKTHVEHERSQEEMKEQKTRMHYDHKEGRARLAHEIVDAHLNRDHEKHLQAHKPVAK